VSSDLKTTRRAYGFCSNVQPVSALGFHGLCVLHACGLACFGAPHVLMQLCYGLLRPRCANGFAAQKCANSVINPLVSSDLKTTRCAYGFSSKMHEFGDKPHVSVLGLHGLCVLHGLGLRPRVQRDSSCASCKCPQT